MWKIFEKEISLIKDKHVAGFVKYALTLAPEQFWTAPCSSTGKHHPPENNSKGDLIRHIIKAVSTAYELCNFYGLYNTDKDIVIASTILHDIKKNGEPWVEYTNVEHGLIAYNWLMGLNGFKTGYENFWRETIANAVRYHMRRWAKPDSELERAKNPTIIENIVQLSDFFASRKGASFLPSISLTDEQINLYRLEHRLRNNLP